MIQPAPITASLEIDSKKGTINSAVWILWLKNLVEGINALTPPTP
jgi:hypothetical protein